MFNSITEKIIVALVTSGAIGIAIWAWNQAVNTALSFGPPSGSVVLSTVDCGRLSGGWETFDEASGRFIVGVGSGEDVNGLRRDFLYGATSSGEYDVALRIEEMPAHRHSLKTGYDYNAHNGLAGSAGSDKDRGIFDNFDQPNPEAKQDGGHGELRNVLQEVGEGRAHNNLPPYIAMHLCKKA